MYVGLREYFACVCACLVCVCVYIWRWGHHPLQGACVFSWFPSQHCSFLTLHFLPPGWLTEVHKLQWTLLCLLLSWGSFGPNQNLQYHRVNWKLLKLPVNPAFTARKNKTRSNAIRDTFNAFLHKMLCKNQPENGNVYFKLYSNIEKCLSSVSWRTE